MASQINPQFPVFGTPTTKSVRDNFDIAQVEITELQTAISELQSRVTGIHDEFDNLIVTGGVPGPAGPPGPTGPPGPPGLGLGGVDGGWF